SPAVSREKVRFSATDAPGSNTPSGSVDMVVQLLRCLAMLASFGLVSCSPPLLARDASRAICRCSGADFDRETAASQRHSRRGADGSTVEYAMQLRTLVLACATVLLSSGVSAQQAVPDPRGANLTRAELEEMLQSFQETASSSAFSGDARQEARNHAEMIRRRLSEGDLQVGDRIELVVEGHPDLTQTFTVGAGRVLPLPAIGEVQLSGVLRSELQDHLTEYIGRYIVNP